MSASDDRANPRCMHRDEVAQYQIGDIVWAKVASHPWWPGEIFDPAFASEEAKLKAKQGKILVAFYGDYTFSWLDCSHVRAFEEDYGAMVEGNSSKKLQCAVLEALDEVSRRAELSLLCRCRNNSLTLNCKKNPIFSLWAQGLPPVRPKDVTISRNAFIVKKCLRFLKDVACSFRTFGKTSMYEAVVARGHVLGLRTWLFSNIGNDVILAVDACDASLDMPDGDATSSSAVHKSIHEDQKCTIGEGDCFLNDWRLKECQMAEGQVSRYKSELSTPSCYPTDAMYLPKQGLKDLQLLASDPLCYCGERSRIVKIVDIFMKHRNLAFEKRLDYNTILRGGRSQDENGKDVLRMNEHAILKGETRPIRYCRPPTKRYRLSGSMENSLDDVEMIADNSKTVDGQTKALAITNCPNKMDADPCLNTGVAVFQAQPESPKKKGMLTVDVHELLLEVQKKNPNLIKNHSINVHRQEHIKANQKTEDLKLSTRIGDMCQHRQSSEVLAVVNEALVDAAKDSLSEGSISSGFCPKPGIALTDGMDSDSGPEIGSKEPGLMPESGTGMSSLPVGLHIQFPSRFAVPCELKLSTIFAQFSGLDSAKIRVFRETAAAQVIFKHAKEAEKAYNCIKEASPFGDLSIVTRLQFFAFP